MDWFLYDNGLRHERVNNENMMEVAQGENSVNVTENQLNKYKEKEKRSNTKRKEVKRKSKECRFTLS